MCLWLSCMKYLKKIFFCILKVTEKSDPELDLDPLVRDPDPHQTATDPQHCYFVRSFVRILVENLKGVVRYPGTSLKSNWRQRMWDCLFKAGKESVMSCLMEQLARESKLMTTRCRQALHPLSVMQ